MAYYVTAQPLGSSRTALCLGPFRCHGDALAHVESFNAWASEHTKEGRDGFVTFGTSYHKTGHRPARFNDLYGVMRGSDGYCMDVRRAKFKELTFAMNYACKTPPWRNTLDESDNAGRLCLTSRP